MLNALGSSIATLAAAHASRDPFTAKHQDRVALLAGAIGARLGLRAQRLEALHLAAIVHDIGKLALPAEILGKPGALSDIEYALVKTHSAIGHGILQNLQSPLPIAEITYQHHERLDGSGYPRGLSGDGILLEARILSVADVYDAMTSNRAYRPGLPVDFVLEKLQEQAGTLLDSNAVAACQQYILTQASPGRASGSIRQIS